MKDKITPMRYDEDLVEAVVFLCANDRHRDVPSLQIARFHRERETLYSILDPDERNAAFFKLHLEWFREWGLERIFLDLQQEFPLLSGQIRLLAVRKAGGRHDEGAELYVNEAGQRNAVVALRPERFAADMALRPFLRHEFTHLHDMVDPAFGYSPDLKSRGSLSTPDRLVRERYRLLWDITIDGRLARASHQPMTPRDRHFTALTAAFPFWPRERQSEVFESLWANPSPRHDELVALSTDPRNLRGTHQPTPGASCPLCGFSTFDWASAEQLESEMRVLIQSEFPDWEPEHGLCGRCREAYQVAASGRASGAN